MILTDWFRFGCSNRKKSNAADRSRTTAGSRQRSTRLSTVYSTRKILMIQEGEYNREITEQAIEIAQRLSCEVLALDIAGNREQGRKIDTKAQDDRFPESVRNNNQFISLARARGIRATHNMDTGKVEDVVARIRAAHAGVRFVTCQPQCTPARVKKVQDFHQIESNHAFA